MQEESQKCITEKPEEAMEFNQNEMDQPAVSPTEELIRNIAGEIALLRNEISSLRNDFEAFKCGKNTATEEAPVQGGERQGVVNAEHGLVAEGSDSAADTALEAARHHVRKRESEKTALRRRLTHGAQSEAVFPP